MACSSDAQRVTLGSWDLAKFSTNGVPCPTASATQELPGGDPGQPGDQQDSSPPNSDLGHLIHLALFTLLPGLLGVPPEQEQLGR